MKQNSNNYSNMRQSQILFYMHQRPIVPAHGTQYEEYTSNHHGGMHEDGQTDRWVDAKTDGLDPFLYSPIPLRLSGE